jgi:hypothetical protein
MANFAILKAEQFALLMFFRLYSCFDDKVMDIPLVVMDVNGGFPFPDQVLAFIFLSTVRMERGIL